MLHEFIQGKKFSDLSTLGIGGPVEFYTEVKDIPQMQKVLSFCKEKNYQFFILGKGSNCLFSDAGFRGVVIHNKIDFCTELSPGCFYVGAGYSFSHLGMQTAKKGWTGLEFAAGIPASVGGAVFMNAGAQGTEVEKTIKEVEFIDANGVLQTFKKKDLEFSYRSSSFQKMKGAIVSAKFELTQSLDARPKQLELLDYRIRTQPYHEKSAGCIFRNPTGGSAGALIDRCGLKGVRIGDAEVSFMHGNFLVNKGKASFHDMKALIEKVKHEVKMKEGIELEQEVREIV